MIRPTARPDRPARLSRADVLIPWKGLGRESRCGRFLTDMGDDASARLTDGITPVALTCGNSDRKPGPDAWMSVTNARIHVETIAFGTIRLAGAGIGCRLS